MRKAIGNVPGARWKIGRSRGALRRVGRKCAVASIAIILSAWSFWSCKDDISGQGTEGIIFPADHVSYGKQVQPLFDRGCGFSGCHGYDTFADRGYSLDSYDHATSRLGIIVACYPNEACNPENSILIRRIEGLDNLPRMPLYRPQLTDNQINGMKQWIREGAQNN